MFPLTKNLTTYLSHNLCAVLPQGNGGAGCDHGGRIQSEEGRNDGTDLRSAVTGKL